MHLHPYLKLILRNIQVLQPPQHCDAVHQCNSAITPEATAIEIQVLELDKGSEALHQVHSTVPCGPKRIK